MINSIPPSELYCKVRCLDHFYNKWSRSYSAYKLHTAAVCAKWLKLERYCSLLYCVMHCNFVLEWCYF